MGLCCCCSVAGRSPVLDDPTVVVRANVSFIHINRGWNHDNIGCPGILYVKDDKLVYKLDGRHPCALCTRSYNLRDIRHIEVCENQTHAISGRNQYNNIIYLQLNPGLKIVIKPPDSNGITLLVPTHDARSFATHFLKFDLPDVDIKY